MPLTIRLLSRTEALATACSIGLVSVVLFVWTVGALNAMTSLSEKSSVRVPAALGLSFMLLSLVVLVVVLRASIKRDREDRESPYAHLGREHIDSDDDPFYSDDASRKNNNKQFDEAEL